MMRRETRDLVVVGGGPAGIAAAVSARRRGVRDVLLIERDDRLGGILNQCVHDGFGLHRFGKSLTGPEYAHRDITSLEETDIQVMLKTMVISVDGNRVVRISSRQGLSDVHTGAVIFAMGCRERTAGAIGLPGTRPSGVFTAGSAQNLLNLQNIMVGKKVAILGSGDIGLIMARRLRLEGAEVVGVFELLPFAGGLQRNIRQCLHDYGIPLHLNTTVTEIHGLHRVTGVTVAGVDANRQPVPGTERRVECDTLLLSVGLIPENELARDAGVPISPLTGGAIVDDTLMTGVDGIFSCGNVLHVHDLVDHVSLEGELAGESVAGYLAGKAAASGAAAETAARVIPVRPGEGVRYTVPQSLSTGGEATISFRADIPSRDSSVCVLKDGTEVIRRKRIRIHPSEMERIAVPEEIVRSAKILEVRIR